MCESEAPARVIVADDEKWARHRLVELLRQRADVEVVAVVGDGREAVQAVAQLAPDLLFLDVQMPEIDGFDVLRHLRASDLATPAVVFVTAFDTYAVQAFDAHALDYLLKPYTDERFGEALDRALCHLDREHLAQHHAQLADVLHETEAALPTRLVVKEGTQVAVVDPDGLVWAEAQDVYVNLHTDEGDVIVRQRLYQIHDRLDPECFVRAHRSAVVNGTRIVRLVPGNQGRATLHMDDGSEVPVSRSCRADVNALLDRLAARA
ncbi:MAG: LytTR family DNA-binding domain-containing protein [Bacteroidota bacterium]